MPHRSKIASPATDEELKAIKPGYYMDVAGDLAIVYSMEVTEDNADLKADLIPKAIPILDDLNVSMITSWEYLGPL